ncbi:MAG: starch-binding protein [Bacteroidales bacterium]|nr:starch-binding protein [Bacteroidales bacterium]
MKTIRLTILFTLLIVLIGFLVWTGCSKEKIEIINPENVSEEIDQSADPQLKAGNNAVMIQTFTLFTERWPDIQSKASAWGNAGFTMAWLPPCSRSADTYGYLPTQWYDHNNWRGSSSELSSCISAIRNAGMTPIADIVLNHRNGNETAGADFVNPAFADNAAAVTSTDECNCGTGGPDQGTDFNGGRDLNHNNSSVRSLSQEFVSHLMSLGFGGGRYDMVLGYNASTASSYRSSGFNVGEYWLNDRNAINNWANTAGMNAFDFPTYYALQSAINNNNYGALNGLPGLIGINPGRSVTFAGNHDTPSVGLLGLVYIMTHPGIPCVAVDEWYSHSGAISTLIGIRRSQGIGQTSSVAVQTATSSVYAAIIDGNTAMKIGPGSWSPGTGWTLATSGNNYAVWTYGGGGGTGGDGMTVHAYDYTHIYFWNASDGSTTSWPGEQMTSEGGSWYRYTFSSASSTNLIFSNNGSNQTSDLYREGDGWYYDGSWYSSQPNTDDGGDDGDDDGGGDGYASNYSSMYLRGTMNSWGTTAMTLVGDNQWEVTLNLSGSYEYKYDAYGDWSTNWGDNNADGYADPDGANITGTFSGSVTFRFNDATLAHNSSGAVSGDDPPADDGGDDCLEAGERCSSDSDCCSGDCSRRRCR